MPNYEDGLHPVVYDAPELVQYNDSSSTAPQVYMPDRSAASAPQPYQPIEKDEHVALQSIDAETKQPPAYEGNGIIAHEKPSVSQSSQKLLGLKRRTAIILIAIVTLLVVVLALSIGLGVGLTQNKAKSQSQQVSQPTGSTGGATSINAEGGITSMTPTTSQATSTTSYSAATSGFTGLAEVKCPGINNTVVSSGSSNFRTLCAVHWITGQAAANNNGTVKAVGSNKLVAYTLEECLGHCVDYNNNLNKTVNPNENGSGCLAVTFNANLTSAFKSFEQNCFLKDRQGVYDPAEATTESAILLKV